MVPKSLIHRCIISGERVLKAANDRTVPRVQLDVVFPNCRHPNQGGGQLGDRTQLLQAGCAAARRGCAERKSVEPLALPCRCGSQLIDALSRGQVGFYYGYLRAETAEGSAAV